MYAEDVRKGRASVCVCVCVCVFKGVCVYVCVRVCVCGDSENSAVVLVKPMVVMIIMIMKHDGDD